MKCEWNVWQASVCLGVQTLMVFEEFAFFFSLSSFTASVMPVMILSQSSFNFLRFF